MREKQTLLLRQRCMSAKYVPTWRRLQILKQTAGWCCRGLDACVGHTAENARCAPVCCQEVAQSLIMRLRVRVAAGRRHGAAGKPVGWSCAKQQRCSLDKEASKHWQTGCQQPHGPGFRLLVTRRKNARGLSVAMLLPGPTPIPASPCPLLRHGSLAVRVSLACPGFASPPAYPCTSNHPFTVPFAGGAAAAAAPACICCSCRARSVGRCCRHLPSRTTVVADAIAIAAAAGA